jgi:hypothetical protein
MDAACVIYHPDSTDPASKLTNINLPNGSSVEKIVEEIDKKLTAQNIPITPIDSATVDITTTGLAGHTLKADVKLSAQAGNTLQAVLDGLFVPSPAASLAVSPDAGNQIVTHANGIYVAEITVARIIELVQTDAAFKAMICSIMNECMGACPGIVDITTG